MTPSKIVSNSFSAAKPDLPMQMLSGPVAEGPSIRKKQTNQTFRLVLIACFSLIAIGLCAYLSVLVTEDH